MADDGTRKLGPGTLKIGATGSSIDVSCLINNATIAASKDQGDSTTKLCGTVKPGATNYTYTLAGNIDTDVADDAGFFAITQTAPGTEQDFTYTPHDPDGTGSDTGTTATGKCVIDPLDFGGDTMGEVMTSDFEFAIVGKPTYAYEVVALADEAADEAVA
jgi:hypothetical protein